MIKNVILGMPTWRFVTYAVLMYLLATSLPGLLFSGEGMHPARITSTVLLLLVPHGFIFFGVRARWPSLLFPAVCGSAGFCLAVVMKVIFIGA